MPENETKNEPAQSAQAQTQASSQSQYIPDKSLRRVCIEKADKCNENKK